MAKLPILPPIPNREKKANACGCEDNFSGVEGSLFKKLNGWDIFGAIAIPAALGISAYHISEKIETNKKWTVVIAVSFGLLFCAGFIYKRTKEQE